MSEKKLNNPNGSKRRKTVDLIKIVVKISTQKSTYEILNERSKTR
jgi:hypothetical protein